MNTPARVMNLDDHNGSEIAVGMDQLGVSAAEVNQQIATAKAYPRSLQRFRQELLGQVTLSESIAQSCLYALPRGGKKIEGPSIRFAEIAMGCWGNCRATARIVAETENFIVAQGIFIDLERNVAVGIEVNRRIIDSKGKRFDIDMIGVTGAAASSIALRNAILRGIPRALFEEGYIAAKRTVSGTMATLADRRNRMLEAFAPYNVTQEQILASVGKSGLIEIGLNDLVTLGGYLTAIQQEERDPEEIFAPVATKTPARPRGAPAAVEQKPAVAPPAGAPANPPTHARPVNTSDAGAAGSEAPAPEQSAPGDDDDGGYSALLESYSGALADARTLNETNAVEGMFAQDFANAPAPTQALAKQVLAEARAAIQAALDAADDDGFPGDRPAPGGEG